MKSLYVNTRFFLLLIAVGFCYVLAFFFPVLMNVAHAFLVLVVIAFIVDYLLIFTEKQGVLAQRILPEKLSNGDKNQIKIDVKNNFAFKIIVKIIATV